MVQNIDDTDNKYRRLQPEEFQKVAAGGDAGLRKKQLFDILLSTEEAISTSELRDMMQKIDPSIKTTDDILPSLNLLKKEGNIDKAKHGITYYWRKK